MLKTAKTQFASEWIFNTMDQPSIPLISHLLQKHVYCVCLQVKWGRCAGRLIEVKEQGGHSQGNCTNWGGNSAADPVFSGGINPGVWCFILWTKALTCSISPRFMRGKLHLNFFCLDGRGASEGGRRWDRRYEDVKSSSGGVLLWGRQHFQTRGDLQSLPFVLSSFPKSCQGQILLSKLKLYLVKKIQYKITLYPDFLLCLTGKWRTGAERAETSGTSARDVGKAPFSGCVYRTRP